ncbi:uncharacterized protein [Centroberyx affinis]|uniref:uncharacterized protein isoform X2 n=1 Tax=Centroberyx affinis TaxID=166261 RepID=UPI003A5BEB71
MSQLRSPTTDTQALLQSMLKRLTLQPGADGQACLRPPGPTAASAPDRGQSGGRGAPSLQTAGRVNSIPVNGVVQTNDITSEPKVEGRGGLGNNGNPRHEVRRWDSREEFGIPAWDSELGRPAVGLKGRQPGCELEMMAFSSSPGLVSSPSHKDNTDSDRGEDRGSGQAVSPAVTPTGTGQLLPAKSPKDADATSFQRTEDEIQEEKEGDGRSAMKKYIPAEDFIAKDAVTDGRVSLPDASPLTSGTPAQTQDHDGSPASVQGFTPRVYTWSLKPAEANLGTDSEGNKVLHLGNGGVGALAQSKDMEAWTANSTSDRKLKKRLSEVKTRRWTQKIKERWRERHGSLGKKGKEEGGGEMKNETENEQPSAAETLINTSNKEGGRTPHSLDRSDNIDTPPTLSHTEDGTADSHIRSTSDFEFGLGSFSLLEEILTGQEWAKFLNPTLSGISTNQGASEQPTSQLETTPNPQHRDGGQSSAIPNSQWSFRGSESPQVSDFGMAPISVNMDISEPNHMPGQDVQGEASQSEPMEHGHTQSDMESEESGPGLEHTAQEDFSHIKPADILDNSALKSRVHLNRKRVHPSQEKRGAEEGETTDRREAERDEFLSSPSTATSHERTEFKDDNVTMPLYPPMSPPLLSPSSTTPRILAPRSVLKHSISQDSQSSISTETVTKKRRVEEGRRVRFSEAVVTIAPIDLNPDGTDSEEDSGTGEEDSVIEEEVGMEQAAVAAAAPAPRPGLPAWILALKRRKTGRKHRQ